VVKNDTLIRAEYLYELSTAQKLQDKEYSTQWLGKGRYQAYKINT